MAPDSRPFICKFPTNNPDQLIPYYAFTTNITKSAEERYKAASFPKSSAVELEI